MDALALENARALLGVSEHADDVTINRACRRLSLSSHPDRGGSTAKQQRINGARDLLIADLQRLPPSGQPPAGPGGVAGEAAARAHRARRLAAAQRRRMGPMTSVVVVRPKPKRRTARLRDGAVRSGSGSQTPTGRRRRVVRQDARSRPRKRREKRRVDTSTGVGVFSKSLGVR